MPYVIPTKWRSYFGHRFCDVTSRYVLQRMIDICVDEATNLCMQFNSKKCSVIRFGPRYHSQCTDVTMLGNSILLNSVKLLGVQLSAYKKFRIDIGYMKSKFYRAFNGLFHNAAKLKDLVSSYCKPCLLLNTAQKLWL